MIVNSPFRETDWLPTSAKEVKKREWDALDVILFTGDAYVDHPSFGASVIGRIIEAQGLRVAIVPQPNWRDDLRDFRKLGPPKLFFGITAGAMDSMVNHYTANKRLRSNDAYTPGGKSGARPDYATIVYSRIVKSLYPDIPVIIGGIEASLRRLTHYDYWSDSLKPGILSDSEADLLIYGMGEQAVKEIVRLLKQGVPFGSLTNIPQTSYISNKKDLSANPGIWETKELHSHEKCLSNKTLFAENFAVIETESNTISAKRLIQSHKDKTIVINPPYPLTCTEELDSYYELPFTRLPHPRYHKKDAIPAYEMIRHSITIHRGCFGGCSFCTISAHQGKFISSRSEESILSEVSKVTAMPDFKGYITDLGGPSANMYDMAGKDIKICTSCTRPSCIFPGICNNLSISHKSLRRLYSLVRNYPDIKKVAIGSGLRYDLFLNNQRLPENEKYLTELIKYHVSGRLKVAPEHSSEKVLKIMRKPKFESFKLMSKRFEAICKQNQLNYQLIPYFISSHPGCLSTDMASLAIEVKKLNFRPEQVQDFTPTPMTLATVMYYTGIDPYRKKSIHIAKEKQAKLIQKRFFFWYKNEYKKEIIRELNKNGRNDLIEMLFNRPK